MAETRKAKYTNGAPKIDWDRVATLENKFEEVCVDLGATIVECGLAFQQYVIHQTKLYMERFRDE